METPLTQNIGPGKEPPNLDQYQATGGYQGLRKALESSPSETIEVVKQSNLSGRGGAGFPTGLKWSFVPSGENSPTPKYLIANGDEMEPGTFKDRLLVEGDPHQLIEGMIISAYAIGASVGYNFLRCEDILASELCQKALTECRQNNLLGKDILGSGFDFELYVHGSAGRYICGE